MSWPKGKPRSDETKARMRAAHAGRPGRPQTEETREKIRVARAAREALKPPKPVRERRPNGWRWTDEQRARLSEARSGLRMSVEGRASLAVSRRTEWDTLSPEERAQRVAHWQLRQAGVVDPRRPRARRPSGPCQKCGTVRQSLHREHIHPRWKGGTEDAENIQWLCANCHEDKTRQDMIGRPGWNTGRKHTEDARRKMRAAAQRRLADSA